MALVRLGFSLARVLPLQGRVVLATSHADALSGNLACIRDELARRTPPVPTVTLAYRGRGGYRGRMGAVWHSLLAGYHLATARVFLVDDYFFPLYVIRRRPGTTVAQVWHASGAFKKFGYSVLDKSFGVDEEFVSRVRIHSNYDLCLVSAQSFAPYYAEAFAQPLAKFVSHLGIPRTDNLVCAEEKATRLADAVRRRYRIPRGRTVILYAPTFRGDSIGSARYHDELDIPLLHSLLGQDHVLLMRLHPFVRESLQIQPELRDFTIDVSSHPDINELMHASDLLITDYSSAIFEYSLLGRPMLFFAPDHEAYERERGFYFDYRSGVPGPVFETTRALAECIRAGHFDAARVEAFRRASFDVADGKSSPRFVDQVVLPALV